MALRILWHHTHIHCSCPRAQGAGGDRSHPLLCLHSEAVSDLLPVCFLPFLPEAQAEPIKISNLSPNTMFWASGSSVPWDFCRSAQYLLHHPITTALCHIIALRCSPCRAEGGHSSQSPGSPGTAPWFPGSPSTAPQSRGESLHRQGAFSPSSPRPSRASLTADPPTPWM